MFWKVQGNRNVPETFRLHSLQYVLLFCSELPVSKTVNMFFNISKLSWSPFFFVCVFTPYNLAQKHQTASPSAVWTTQPQCWRRVSSSCSVTSQMSLLPKTLLCGGTKGMKPSSKVSKVGNLYLHKLKPLGQAKYWLFKALQHPQTRAEVK